MAIFVCDVCGCLENTALAEGYTLHFLNKEPLAKCSECFSGTWHGRFEKRAATIQEIRARRGNGEFFPPTAGLERLEIAWAGGLK